MRGSAFVDTVSLGSQEPPASCDARYNGVEHPYRQLQETCADREAQNIESAQDGEMQREVEIGREPQRFPSNRSCRVEDEQDHDKTPW